MLMENAMGEKLKSDLECLKRVLQRLKENNCDSRSIAVVEGMIDGIKNLLGEEK